MPQSTPIFQGTLSQLYNNVGMHYYDAKDYTKAIESFQKAVSIRADYAQAYFNMACSQSLSGDTANALVSLQKSLELDRAGFLEKAKTDPDLEAVRKTPAFQKIL